MSLRNRDVYKTITVTYNQVLEMKKAQRIAMEELKNKTKDPNEIGKKLGGLATTVFPLVFFQSTAVGVSMGIVALVTTLGTTASANVNANAQNGYNRLSELGDLMYNFGAAKVTMEVAYLEYYDTANKTTLAVIQDVLAKSYTMSNGTVIKP